MKSTSPISLGLVLFGSTLAAQAPPQLPYTPSLDLCATHPAQANWKKSTQGSALRSIAVSRTARSRGRACACG